MGDVRPFVVELDCVDLTEDAQRIAQSRLDGFVIGFGLDVDIGAKLDMQTTTLTPVIWARQPYLPPCGIRMLLGSNRQAGQWTL